MNGVGIYSNISFLCRLNFIIKPKNMKKILVLAAVLFVTATSFAQSDATTTGGTEFSIGVDGALPLGDFKEAYNFGIGGSAKFAYNIDEVIALTLQAGYLSFSGKDLGQGFKLPSLGVIPVKVGGRYTFGGGVYGEPQLGLSFLNHGGGSAFTYAFNLGYHMVPGVDISARYEGFSKSGSSFPQIGFRLAYAFGTSK